MKELLQQIGLGLNCNAPQKPEHITVPTHRVLVGATVSVFTRNGSGPARAQIMEHPIDVTRLSDTVTAGYVSRGFFLASAENDFVARLLQRGTEGHYPKDTHLIVCSNPPDHTVIEILKPL